VKQPQRVAGIEKVMLPVSKKPEPVAQGGPVFYVPFDDGTLRDVVNGQCPDFEDPGSNIPETDRQCDSYVDDGIRGKALHLKKSVQGQYESTYACYTAREKEGKDVKRRYWNFDREKGATEFWVRPCWNIEKPIFDPNDSTGRTILEGLRPYFRVLVGKAPYWNAFRFVEELSQHSQLLEGQSVQYWNEDEWHQIDLTWKVTKADKKNVIVQKKLYIDGKFFWAKEELVEKSTFDQTPCLILVGGGLCTVDAEADIDEVKIYDRVLSDDEVKANYLALFPVEYHIKDTVFFASLSGQQLQVEVRNAGSQTIDGDFNCSLRKYHLAKTVARLPFRVSPPTLWSGTSHLSIPPGQSRFITVPIPSISATGEYYLDCVYVGEGTPKWKRTIRLFAISNQELPSKPETEKLDLDDGICIDCYTGKRCEEPQSPEYSYFQTAGTETCKFPSGQEYEFRRTGTKNGDRFGYLFHVDTKYLGQPHLVVIDYPALDLDSHQHVTDPRTMEIDILEPQGPVVQTGVFTGKEYPCSDIENRLKQHRIIFWPQHEENLITIVNRWEGHRAAALRIYVNRIKGDETKGWFPETNVITPSDGGRLLGLWSEEPTLPGNFGLPRHFYTYGAPYVGPPSIAEFYEALKHMISYLHYTGQNLVVYPIYFYRKQDDVKLGSSRYTGCPVYPSRIEGWPLWGEKGVMHPDDWLELMLRMCEVNHISVIVSFTMLGIPSLESKDGVEPDRYDDPSEVWTHDGSGSLLEERAHEIFKEVLKEYGDYPALKGLSFNVFSLWFEGAPTINLRLRQSKKRTHRYFDEMLWLGYIGGNIVGSIATCRPDLKLVISEWLPTGALGDAFKPWRITDLKAEVNNPQLIRKMYDMVGVRLANHKLLDNELYPRIRIERVLCLSGYRLDNCTHPVLRGFFILRDVYYDEAGRKHEPKYRECCYGLFRKRDNTAAAIYNSYFEGGGLDSYGRPLWPNYDSSLINPSVEQDGNGNWIGTWAPWKDELTKGGFWRFAAPTPGHRYFMENYMLAMAYLDPVQIGIGGSTVGTVGHDVRIEPEPDWPLADIDRYGLPIQNFAKAYRALPAKTFDDVPLTGRSSGPDPHTLGVARQKDGYFYILNKTSNTLWARLNFLPDNATSIRITDLITGKSVAGDGVGQGWQAELRPYELRSFHFDEAGYSLKLVWLSSWI